MITILRNIAISAMMLAVWSSLAATPDYTREAFESSKRSYLDLQNRILLEYLDNGSFPNSDDLLRAGGFEHNMLAMVRVNPDLHDELPRLIIAESNIEDFRFIPGTIIIFRASQAGLNLRSDHARQSNFKLR